MNTLKKLITIVFLTGILTSGCKKEALESANENILKSRDLVYSPIVSGNGTYDEEMESIPTILGAVRTNPYSVQVMTQAWNSLYPNNQFTSLTPTHLYVKFTPMNADELKLIVQTGEMLYDYPLENEIIQLGDYYPQPGREIPEFWAVVCPGFQSPIADYQIISQLIIPPYESILTKTAFDLTGNIWSTPDDPINVPDQNGCYPGGPGYPNCLQTLNRNYSDGQSGDGDPCYQIVGGSDDLVNNSCGCPVYSDIRKPGGCVNV